MSFLNDIKLIDRLNKQNLKPIEFSYPNYEGKSFWEYADYFFSLDNKDKYFDIINFNLGLEDEKFKSNFYFRNTFKNRIKNPSEKTLKNADDYWSWFKMCCALKFIFEGEDQGLELFKLFSSLSKKYNEKETEDLWKNCKPEYGSIAHVYSLIPKK